MSNLLQALYAEVYYHLDVHTVGYRVNTNLPPAVR